MRLWCVESEYYARLLNCKIAGVEGMVMSHRTRTESIEPKLGYSRSDLADVVNSVCN